VTNDHGDVLELCDADGAAFAAYRYDAWGLPQGAGDLATGVWTQATTLVSQALAGQIAARQVLRYASYAYDAESGLYYCSARYYDPATRQWTTGDPAKDDGEESAYQYCGGDAVGNMDPSGLFLWYPKWRTRLWSRNNKGYETESWYNCAQLPEPQKQSTIDGVYYIFRIGARNRSSKGRWVEWQASVQRPYLLFAKKWRVVKTRRFLRPWQTKTVSVKWWSTDVIGSCVRTWGWGGWGSSTKSINPQRRGHWYGVWDAATEEI